jgi:hypothetical protein
VSLLAAPARRVEYPFPVEFVRERYPADYLRQGLLEERVQAACVAYLRARWRAEVVVVDVGDARLRGRAARLLSAAGGNPRLLAGRGGEMNRGIVDLAVTFPGGRAGWFEVKKPAWLQASPKTGRLVQRRPAGEPTPEQLAFLVRQGRAGAVVGVLWHPRDLDALVPAPTEAA